jgi:hypothetical protein
VTASDKKVYAATPFSLFSVDLASKEVQRFSRVSGLSETGISTIAFDPLANRLYIAYSNSNIDLLETGRIRNIPDLKRSTLSGDKNIYHIYPDSNRCYLSTGLGIVVLDPLRGEVRDSWFIGSSGATVKTYGFAKDGAFFYAATEEGLKRTPQSNPNPANFATWQLLSGVNGLPAGPSAGVYFFQNRLLALQRDTLFVLGLNGWSPFFGNDFSMVSVQPSGGSLIVSQRKQNGASQVLALDGSGALLRTLQQPGVISFPRGGIRLGADYWIADRFGGLSHWQGANAEVYKPDSPEDIALGQLLVHRSTLYAAAGTVNDSWNYQYNSNGVYRYRNGSWTNFNRFRIPRLDSLLDFITLAVDPRDGSLWAGSFGGGLLQIGENDALTIHKAQTTLQPTVGDPGSYRVSGLAFDSEQNLWVANFAAQPLHVRRANGTWKAFATPFTLNFNAVSQILIDEAGQKWIVSPLGNGLIVFDHSNTIDNTNDDKWRLYRTGAGLGNLPSNNVSCIAMDKSGFLWVGTDNGVGVIQCPAEVFLSGCEAVLPVIKEGSFSNFLFRGTTVTSIAVDGADRKWMATPNGAWLLSPDGDKVLAHFTETNSPLLSNDVRSIAIDGASGEVYFGTAKGICSFRGTATEAAEDSAGVLVFPNPVPPGYTGSIAIRGLPANSFVRITEPGGRLVFQTRALGGQATWNGQDYRGGRAASGVYLVLARTERGDEKAVGRIVFITK